MRLSFLSVVLYGQVQAYVADHPAPGLLWDDAEMAQGFAWGDGTVAFGVPDHDGESLIQVDTDAAGDAGVSEAALWAVEVPFVAGAAGIMVGTVLLGHACAIAPGRHRLVFEALPGGTVAGVACAYGLRLTFSRGGAGRFAILRRGELGTDRVLRERSARAG